MFSKLVLSALFLFSSLLLAANGDSTNAAIKQHAFVGAETCGMCHKSEKQGKQLDIWKASKHAQAYKALESPEADKIAKEKGFDTPAAKTQACLKCHVSGEGVDASLLGPKFKMEDGVQCETCHGAGADYKTLKVMKDKKLAEENGLVIPGDVKTFCVKCHNSESPTYKEGWDAAASWEKIKHTIPAATN
ncbi:MAG: cytochrome c family protein [Bacteroidetes bacterium]|nr:cytochrome c family protein [Bacteroidota bacterium]